MKSNCCGAEVGGIDGSVISYYCCNCLQACDAVEIWVNDITPDGEIIGKLEMGSGRYEKASDKKPKTQSAPRPLDTKTFTSKQLLDLRSRIVMEFITGKTK